MKVKLLLTAITLSCLAIDVLAQVSITVFLKYDQRHGDNIESEWIA